MSATDRLARVETTLTGHNAWNADSTWADMNMDHVWHHPNGTRRDLQPPTRDRLERLADTLHGCHRNLAAHIRDASPLRSATPLADTMVALAYRNDPQLLAMMPDNEGAFRDMWTLRQCRSDVMPDPTESLLGPEDTEECAAWADRMCRRLAEWGGWTGGELSHLTHGAWSLTMDPLPHPIQGVDVALREWWTEGDALCSEPFIPLGDHIRMRILPDSLDWRHSPDPGIHGIIETEFPHRPNNGRQWDQPRWHRTPERFAGAILRELRTRGMI